MYICLFETYFCNTRRYPVERQTQQLKVNYYVKQDFSKHYAGNIGKIEQEVEEEYIESLRAACYRERNQSIPYFTVKRAFLPWNRMKICFELYKISKNHNIPVFHLYVI